MDINLDLETFIVLNAVSLLLTTYLSPIGNLMNNASIGPEYSERNLKGEVNRVFI